MQEQQANLYKCTQDDGLLVQILDPEIKVLVMLLRSFGLKTFSSCSGHDEGGFQFPTIRIETQNIDADQTLIFEILGSHKYDGYYVKRYYDCWGTPPFLEIEFWGRERLEPNA